jgi:hypothetical protein
MEIKIISVSLKDLVMVPVGYEAKIYKLKPGEKLVSVDTDGEKMNLTIENSSSENIITVGIGKADE